VLIIENSRVSTLFISANEPQLLIVPLAYLYYHIGNFVAIRHYCSSQKTDFTFYRLSIPRRMPSYGRFPGCQATVDRRCT